MAREKNFIPVVLNTKIKNYNAGEIVGFTKDEADQIVKMGWGKLYKPTDTKQETTGGIKRPYINK